MARGKRNRHRGVTRQVSIEPDAMLDQTRDARPLACGAEGCPELGLHEVHIPGVGLVRLCYQHREIARVDAIRAERLSERRELESPKAPAPSIEVKK